MSNDHDEWANAIARVREDMHDLAAKGVIAVNSATTEEQKGRMREQYRAAATARIGRYKAALVKASKVYGWSVAKVVEHRASVRNDLISEKRGQAEPAQQVYFAALEALKDGPS